MEKGFFNKSIRNATNYRDNSGLQQYHLNANWIEKNPPESP